MSSLALLHSQVATLIPLQNELTVTLAGEVFDEVTTSLVIQCALEVHQSAFQMRTSARQLCVSLYKCQEAFIAGSKNGNTHGWGEFCERNFASIGMSDGNIRTAVRTGRALAKHSEKHPEGIEVFDNLSRAALFALGDNEQTLIAVQEALSASPDAVMTAADVRRISEELSSEKILRLQVQQQVSALEQTNLELSESVTARKEQVARYKQEAEAAILSAKTPVEGVVFKLPPGVKSEADLRDKLNRENSTLKTEHERLSSSVDETRRKLNVLQTSFNLTDQTKNALDELESNLLVVIAKFPQSMVEKMSSGTPATKEKLKRIASQLRALANVMDVN